MASRTTARIYRGTPRNLRRLANALRAGELVAVPTETVYGLAANVWDFRACANVFEAKGRPSTDPLIVHIRLLGELHEVAVANDAALALARAFWPGPLTLILPKRATVPDIATAGLPSVAVRMPAHPLFRRLLKAADVPLAAPSANRFGYISPTTALHVQEGLGQHIRYILDGGSAAIGLESTIVDLRNPRQPRVLRPGAISAAQISAVLKRPVRTKHGQPSAASAAAQVSPGQMLRHYSPRTPLTLHSSLTLEAARRAPHEAWIFLRTPAGLRKGDANIRSFSRRGTLEEVAHRLFAILREVDAGRWRAIHAELPLPDAGDLAAAIRDRLHRAAAR
ncbi:threonylcarbamoyl-AMP synthase [Horticoccus luteus]|uniref:Threonylcarbamoyl-AMP synthase n=1 Tax=Horticoccus luteus TaxID=2862869 RepID=A0A8F9TVK1_9BACT|nr:L-threonylcarbamoyladenylate synthase [Horticoccus luteus]QYM78574.1 threonylcarbamoyl-AMP synthase [Horticoccus luteus]